MTRNETCRECGADFSMEISTDDVSQERVLCDSCEQRLAPWVPVPSENAHSLTTAERRHGWLVTGVGPDSEYDGGR